MAEILKYRIPGKEKVEKAGYFRQIKSMKDANGFFMSTFLKDKLIEFIPSSTALNGIPCLFENEPFVISKEEYLKESKMFITAFEHKKIKKAVYSRVKKIKFDTAKINQFFDALCEEYPKAFVYLISGEEVGTWVGATPEILLQTFGNSGFTMALAGTKTLDSKDVKWGEKEILEQAYVTGFIQDKLITNGIKELEINGPYDIQAGPVIHLKTDISFDIEKNQVMEITKTLHPTPAVSGLPQKEAIELINFKEQHEREFYSGIIGVIGENSTSLFVNLRCCQIQKNAAFLYLGGGFTKDSNPELEWEETENKSRTLLNVIEKL